MNLNADADQTLNAFLKAAAAKRPTPGGGAVAALAGAMAASMGSMVLNYSVAKKDLAEYRPQLESALRQFERSRELLLQLMVQDQDAFLELTAARKQREQDRERFGDAVQTAMLVPQAVAAAAVSMLTLANDMAEKVNVFLISDLSVCADLAMATIRCAIANVNANLPDVGDAKARLKIAEDNDRMMKQGLGLIRRISATIATRTGLTP